MTEDQKSLLTDYAKSLPVPLDKLEASLVRGKYKKNGGLVTTVLLLNGLKQACQVNRINVQVMNDTNEIVAEEVFELTLNLEPNTAQPWSFVFSKKSVRIPDTNPINWKIQLNCK